MTRMKTIIGALTILAAARGAKHQHSEPEATPRKRYLDVHQRR